MQIPNINFNVLMTVMTLFVLGVTLGDFPEISRSWWSNLKSFLNTNLENIVTSLNTAIQSSEKGAASGVAALDENGDVPAAQLPGPVGTLAGVKVYQALLTQSGTDAPVATVLENSLGGDCGMGKR